MPKIPLELAQARRASDIAWLAYVNAIDRDEPNGTLDQYALAALICDGRAERIYNEWQLLGGTSDIMSIALEIPEGSVLNLRDNLKNAGFGEDGVF